MKFISKYFINGLIVIVPIAITAYVVINIFSIAEIILGRHLPVQFPGLGLVAVILLILLVGWLSSHWMLRRFLGFGEHMLCSVPVVKVIYKSVKQVSTAVLESPNLFKHAVLVPYPHAGVKALGFVMAELSPPLAENFTEENICVFVPWSLNMTSGVNIIVPKREVIYLQVSSETALQYVITAGAIMPSDENSPDTIKTI